jgi:hypothetical protein
MTNNHQRDLDRIALDLEVWQQRFTASTNSEPLTDEERQRAERLRQQAEALRQMIEEQKEDE